MRKILFTLIIVISSTILSAQINPINNIIGVDVSTYNVQNGTSNYDSSYTIGYDLGMREVGLFLNWTMLEIAPNTFDFTYLDIANVYYPASNMNVDININPINTNRLEVPSDLANLPLDDPQMINRYKVLLDSVKLHIPNIAISSLIIGSEIGAYLANDATKWAQYTSFYNQTMSYAKILWPGLNVAVELQFSDIMNYNNFAQQINVNSDFIGVSYYPLWPDFTVKPTWIVAFDMDTLVDMFPNKPICFYQFGFPSSTSCNSSDSLQADFISQTFTYWDNFANNIRFIDFTWMTDLDTAAINYYGTYYGLTDTVFLEFLRTIGLRTWDGNGADKLALNELRCQAKQRGYNNLNLPCNPTVLPNLKLNQMLGIFPNPGNGIFTVNVEHDGALFIYDLMAKPVFENKMKRGNNQIELFNLSPGIYQVKFLSFEGEFEYSRILICR